MIKLSLQDFIVLPTELFCWCVISNSSVNNLPTEYICRLSFRRWYPIPSLYRSEKQKNHLPTVLQTDFARQKKKFPTEKYRRSFSSSVIWWLKYNRIYLSVNSSVLVVATVKCRRINSVGNLSVNVWNTDRIYLSVNSSVIVEATVKCQRINSVGKTLCNSFFSKICFLKII